LVKANTFNQIQQAGSISCQTRPRTNRIYLRGNKNK
jgi:hypothetical protein